MAGAGRRLAGRDGGHRLARAGVCRGSGDRGGGGGAAWTASRPRLAQATQWAAAAVVPALVLADLWHAGAGKLAILQRRPDAKGLVQLAAMSGAADTWRYHVGNMSSPYGGTVPFHVAFQHDVREWSGYINPIEPQRHADLERRAKATPAILAHFNVRWFAGHRKPPPGRTVAPGVVDIDDVAPVVRWYGGVEVTSDAQLLDALAATPPSATVVAYVEPDDVRGVALPAPAADGVVPAPVAGRVVSFARNAMVVDVDAPAAGVVVIAEPYDRGWTAELVGVDGARRAARLFRADHDLRAVVVPAGTWRIVLRYQPRGYVALVLAFFAGLAGLALAGLGRWRWLDAVPGGPR
ncbi:MAG: hypothetical protein H6709_07380 [Kofleriaceae bacterium]|nr:hypothetical protein [Kofleriaceae bacterium]